MMFVKRNFTVLYKQTILGPAWIILNPLITTVIFNVVFGGMANMPTDGVPGFFVLHGRQYGVDLLCQLRQQYSQYVCDKLTDFWQGVLPAPDDAGQPGADKPNQLRHSGGHVPGSSVYFFCHGQRRTLYAVGAGCAVRLLEVMLLGLGVGIIVSS